jgi:hypothetical protein
LIWIKQGHLPPMRLSRWLKENVRLNLRDVAGSLAVRATMLLVACSGAPVRAGDTNGTPRIQEEVWALPLPLPMFAYVVRPVGDGPFPLVIMNHGVALMRLYAPKPAVADGQWSPPPTKRAG